MKTKTFEVAGNPATEIFIPYEYLSALIEKTKRRKKFEEKMMHKRFERIRRT